MMEYYKRTKVLKNVSTEQMWGSQKKKQFEVLFIVNDV